MPDTTTPGERAYVAYVRVRYGLPEADAALTYTRSIPEERAAWDAAAEAVRADLLPTPERPAVTAAVAEGQAVLDHADFPPLDLRLEDDHA